VLIQVQETQIFYFGQRLVSILMTGLNIFGRMEALPNIDNNFVEYSLFSSFGGLLFVLQGSFLMALIIVDYFVAVSFLRVRFWRQCSCWRGDKAPIKRLPTSDMIGKAVSIHIAKHTRCGY
jgi:hypothetical protein